MVYLEACIILTASHQTMTYSSISYSSWIPIPSSLFSSSRPPSSKPHSNAPPLIPRATNSRRAPRTRLVTVNERTLTVRGELGRMGMAKEREARLFGCCKMLEQTCPVPPRHEAVSRRTTRAKVSRKACRALRSSARFHRG